MMGWLTPHRAGEVGHRHFRAYQCGLCHTLGKEHGLVSRLAAGPDLVAWQVFLDVVEGREAPLSARPCVLNPLGRALPAREATEHTALAAAFGLWMGVEKARDDWRDEGRLLGWLAAAVLRGPGEAARRRLATAGFPVDQVDGWLATQAALERRVQVPLEEAMAPTRAIGRLTFGFAARGRPELRAAAEGVGEALATWLFWVDGLLDWPRDVAHGRANPLARSLPGPAPALPPQALRAHALAEADRALDHLALALDGIGARGLGAAYLRAVLVTGPRDRLRRLAALAPSPALEARDLLPPRPPLGQRLRGILARVAARSRRSRLRFRLQATLALALAWAFPGRSWAQQWWPEAPLPVGPPAALPLPGEAGDTGALDTGGVDSGGLDSGSALLDGVEPVANAPNVGDACANGWGFCDMDSCCEENCFDPCCNEPCDAACADTGEGCGEACASSTEGGAG